MPHPTRWGIWYKVPMTSLSEKIIVSLSLSLIFLLAFFLRTYRLSELPASLHRDEASIGYNALTLLKTAKDEFGQSYPTSFKSFGDYKLPGQIYTSVLSFRFFGVSTWSLRLPVALLGSLTILAIYFLVEELFADKKISLATALLLALSFFHIAGSRNVYEPVAGLLFSILSLTFFLKSRKNLLYILPTAICVIAGLLFYNSGLIILPFLFTSIAFLYRKDFFQHKKLYLIAAAFFLVVGYLVPQLSIIGVNQSRGNTTVFFNQTLKDESNQRFYQLANSGLPIRLIAKLEHPVFVASHELAKNYLKNFDLSYLFIKGDHNPWHNLRGIGFGNLNIVILPWIFFGIFRLLKTDKSQGEWFLLSYLLISPLPSAITVDAPISNRLFDFHLSLLLIAAYGFWQFYSMYSKRVLGKLAIFIGAIAYLLFANYFLLHYFLRFNKNLDKVWYPGLPEAIAKLDGVSKEYEAIYIDPNIVGNYILFAFYSQYDPEVFLEETVDQQGSGYNRLSYLGKYRFYSPVEESVIKEKSLVLEQVLQEQVAKEPLFVIRNWEDKPLWQAYEL